MGTGGAAVGTGGAGTKVVPSLTLKANKKGRKASETAAKCGGEGSPELPLAAPRLLSGRWNSGAEILLSRGAERQRLRGWQGEVWGSPGAG